MAVLAPPCADLPMRVWCITNKSQHFLCRAPIIEKLAGNQSYILSFSQKSHANMFRNAVLSRRIFEKEWPRITLDSDYSVEVAEPNEENLKNIELDIDEVKLPELLERCNLNGVSIGLMNSVQTNRSKYRFQGSKITTSDVYKLEDYRKQLRHNYGP